MTLSSVLRLFCNGLSAAIAAPAVTMDPNPATDEVKVTYTTGSKKKAEVWVLDLSGVCIYTNDLGVTQAGNVGISQAKFAAGVYMVELTSGNQKAVQRLIKD